MGCCDWRSTYGAPVLQEILRVETAWQGDLGRVHAHRGCVGRAACAVLLCARAASLFVSAEISRDNALLFPRAKGGGGLDAGWTRDAGLQRAHGGGRAAPAADGATSSSSSPLPSPNASPAHHDASAQLGMPPHQ
jgi:hypothetical protein